MYEIEFYEKENGESDVWNFLEELREKSNSSKDSRIQYKQLMLHIQLLQNNGTRLPNNITKHIEEDIWELRPGNDTFVLLHHFRKKTQKTPKREIEKAKSERDDYLFRKGK